ncbi:uncharacterized protein LOC136068358 [Quercus suber]|uniref:uncharacterized protein LOC136068358 n=1 Tax=Quercus suber TaxID=58331 RepID=UPI0032DF32AC
MQLEIDQLKRELRHAKRNQASLNSDVSSDDERDINNKRRSRTPPSESFSYEEEHHRERRFRSPSHRGVGNDTMSKTLNQISMSPFTRKIEEAKLPRCFHQLTFTIYNGRIDLVEHVSHFNQRMVVHSKDEALMCKVFPSSLGPVAMRWFDNLRADSISSFKELTQAFGSRFVTCRKVAISTFKLDLLAEHSLRKSLTGKFVISVRQLMDKIDKYKIIEEDQQQEKGKDKVISQEMRDFRSDRYSNNKPQKDFVG